ncbi:hypothetical protein A33Q_0836 [Indibacter alkaliphilus LW1]|uniref:Uncharacterized protein n=1 Tax=Indibacter alkaliphilus (strain CCUG 57479 / KCTC 22604 / LW1) TaxID=1189612 RepID=S2E3A5_INDAL|nr:hypothetical protein A33Q_0836 [Indibacter alkaliphilus LW1]
MHLKNLAINYLSNFSNVNEPRKTHIAKSWTFINFRTISTG